MSDYSRLSSYTDIELVLSLINEKHRTRVFKKGGGGGGGGGGRHHCDLKERE